VLEQIRAAFGDEFFDGGSLNRAALAEYVFPDTERTARLNEIVWTEVAKDREAFLRKNSNTAYGTIFLSAPLLFETGMEKSCDEVWLISADEALRVKRAAERDGVTEESVRLRAALQLSDAEKAEKSCRVIRNDGSREDLLRNLDKELRSL
jgi:dephospho-CoA kinase